VIEYRSVEVHRNIHRNKLPAKLELRVEKSYNYLDQISTKKIPINKGFFKVMLILIKILSL